jgi:SAM-dependent methyltransferase
VNGGANTEQRAYWNRDEARHWVEHQRRYDEMLEPFGEAILTAAAIAPELRVLDVGCGNGKTTRDVARAATRGSALGVDLSERMIERARETARTEGVENVIFEVDDAQTRTFAPEFDRVISRFGVMFFDDPVAAFTNIRRAIADHGRVAFSVWRDMLENDWMMVPAAAALAHVPMPDLGAPGAPGPYALADAERLRGILDAAGYTDVSIDPFDALMLVGGRGTVDEAVTFMRNTGMGHGLLDEHPEDVQARVLDAVRDALAPHATDDGVRLRGAAWIVTASTSRR